MLRDLRDGNRVSRANFPACSGTALLRDGLEDDQGNRCGVDEVQREHTNGSEEGDGGRWPEVP